MPDKVLDSIENRLDDLCRKTREKHIQNILAAQLKCERRARMVLPQLPDLEIDVLGENFAIEVKHNASFHAGIAQVLGYRLLAGIENVYLLHLHYHPNLTFLNAISKYAQELDFIGIIIDKREKAIEVVGDE